MSTEEQAQIVGSLVLDRKECINNISALEEKLKLGATKLAKFATDINGCSGGLVVSKDFVEDINRDASKLPVTADLLSTLAELVSARHRKSELDYSLAKFGL